jgi:hypothetical protein
MVVRITGTGYSTGAFSSSRGRESALFSYKRVREYVRILAQGPTKWINTETITS